MKGMTLAIAASPPPLRTDADGVVRVGTTRVSLDTLIAAFLEGATAEEITQQYPSLSLSTLVHKFTNVFYDYS
jgi:hypothetical protein